MLDCLRETQRNMNLILSTLLYKEKSDSPFGSIPKVSVALLQSP